MFRISFIVLGPILFATLATAETPSIFWASSPVRPDETVLIAGHALADSGSSESETSV